MIPSRLEQAPRGHISALHVSLPWKEGATCCDVLPCSTLWGQGGGLVDGRVKDERVAEHEPQPLMQRCSEGGDRQWHGEGR